MSNAFQRGPQGVECVALPLMVREFDAGAMPAKTQQPSRFRSLSLLVLVSIGMMSAAAWAEQPGQKLFEKRCGQCHALPDPNTTPPEGWSKRLDEMAPYAGLKSKEKAEVTAYLQSHSQQATTKVSLAEEQRLFEKKCSLCHTPQRVFQEPLTADSRRHIVQRMQARVPGWISMEEAEQILDYLDKAQKQMANRQKKGTQTATILFRDRCSVCHTLERVYLRLENQKAPAWGHIVKRMRSKAPESLEKNEAEQILVYLQSLKPVGTQAKN